MGLLFHIFFKFHIGLWTLGISVRSAWNTLSCNFNSVCIPEQFFFCLPYESKQDMMGFTKRKYVFDQKLRFQVMLITTKNFECWICILGVWTSTIYCKEDIANKANCFEFVQKKLFHLFFKMTPSKFQVVAAEFEGCANIFLHMMKVITYQGGHKSSWTIFYSKLIFKPGKQNLHRKFLQFTHVYHKSSSTGLHLLQVYSGSKKKTTVSNNWKVGFGMDHTLGKEGMAENQLQFINLH